MPSPKVLKLLQDAIVHHNAGRLPQAEALYLQARKLEPQNFDTLHLLGFVQLQQGKMEEAVALLSTALRLSPKHSLCALRLAQALMATKRMGQAEQVLHAGAKHDPRLPDFHTHLATVYRHLGRIQEAVTACRRAVELRPDFADAYDQLGGLVVESSGHLEAEPFFRKAIALKPDDPRPWCNLGICLSYRKDLTEAIPCFEKAIALDPRMSKAHAGRGLALERLYRIPEAVQSLRRALELDPRAHDARSCLLLNLHYLPDIPRAQLFEEHLAFGRALPPSPAAPTVPPVDGRRLRVGFLSPDLRGHSVAYFISPLIKGLDHARFELFLYHDHPTVDWMSTELRGLVQNWRHCAGMPDDTLEKTIRNDHLDLLVDLAGHTGFNRLFLYARRLAPVQATYLGYPDTTGVPAMDFRLSDAKADPMGDADAYCTEQLVRFSDCAWCFTPHPEAPSPRPSEQISSAEGIRFGCFNNFSKITDPSLEAWGRLLAAVPGSRLILKNHGLDSPDMQATVRERFSRLQLDPARIELLGRTERLQDHLACYHQVDIALDSFPYHGTTTTCEALHMGVPVLTLVGDRHASRVGSSLLHSVGHPEWIAHSWDELVAVGRNLASDPEKLAALRSRLRQDLLGSVICNHTEQARRFGEALERMIRSKASA